MQEREHSGPVGTLIWTFSRAAMWAPAFIVLIIFYEVVMRYVFYSPTYWVNEMSLWVGGMIYVTSGLYAMQQRSHIRIFILYDISPIWLRRVFDVLSTVCVCIFVFAVIWGGYNEATSRFWSWERFGTVFDPPIPAINKPVILIALFVLALQAVSNLVRDWPAGQRTRQGFDIISTVILIGLLAAVIPGLLDFSDTGPSMPTGWRIAIGIGVLVSAFAIIKGLIRDFNITPEPFVETNDPADEFAPSPVLTTTEPVTTSAGKNQNSRNN